MNIVWIFSLLCAFLCLNIWMCLFVCLIHTTVSDQPYLLSEKRLKDSVSMQPCWMNFQFLFSNTLDFFFSLKKELLPEFYFNFSTNKTHLFNEWKDKHGWEHIVRNILCMCWCWLFVGLYVCMCEWLYMLVVCWW